MSAPIVELSADELVDDADRTAEMLRAVAFGPHRLSPQPRPKLLSLALPPVIVEVPEHEDAESAAKTLEIRRSSSRVAIVPPEPPTQPNIAELDASDLVDGSRETPGVTSVAAEQILIEPGPYSSVAPAEIELTHEHLMAQRRPLGAMWIVAGAVAVCGVLGLLAGAIALYRHEGSSAATASRSEPIARTAPVAVKLGAPAKAITTPAPVADEKTVAVDALPQASTAGAAKPAAVKTATAPAAKTEATPAEKTEDAPVAKPSAKVETGTIRTFSSAAGKEITVDGKSVGAAGAPIEIACGHRSIAVGDARARAYDVPCNGAITVGSP